MAWIARVVVTIQSQIHRDLTRQRSHRAGARRAMVTDRGSNSVMRASHQDTKLASMGRTPRAVLSTGRSRNANRVCERPAPYHRRRGQNTGTSRACGKNVLLP